MSYVTLNDVKTQAFVIGECDIPPMHAFIVFMNPRQDKESENPIHDVTG